MKTTVNKVTFYLVCALFVFLPFSSWLVSLMGSSMVSLFRDFLIILIFILSLIFVSKKRENKTVFYLALAFIFWGAASFFWREASVLQWLKGFRFTFLPIALFVALSGIKFDDKQKKILYSLLLFGGIIISVLGILQLLGVDVPLRSVLSGEGALESLHFVGNSKLIRLQSVLAGPNALGLYMLALSAFALGLFKKVTKYSVLFLLLFGLILALSFSRSALLGFVAMLICLFFLFLNRIYGKLISLIFTILLVAAIGIWGLYFLTSKNDKIQNFLTHGDSSSLRVEQYQRIWDDRFQIGLLGRGTGTAGPSSQYRLDQGENHWTENIYLDTFEELGLTGLIILLSLVIAMIAVAYRLEDQDEQRTAFSLILSFAITGLFINYYTGQAGIFLLWLAAALLFANKEEKV